MEDAGRLRFSKEPVETRLASITAGQHGVLTRAQALSGGMDPRTLSRRVKAGRLERIHPGVYRLAGTPETWEQRVLAGCLWSGGVASHRAAARLWRLDGVEQEVVELITARNLSAPGICVHSGRVDRPDLTSIGPIRTTGVARTLLDLGAVVEPATVAAALTDTLRRRLTTVGRIHRCLERAGGKGRPGTAALRSLVSDLDGRGPESVLELRLLRTLRRAGFPEPVPQFSVRRHGRLVARVDFAYPEIRLAIEADGYRYHGGPGDWARGVARRNALTAEGWHVIHVTWADLTTNPDGVTREIRAIMRRLRAVSRGSFSPR